MIPLSRDLQSPGGGLSRSSRRRSSRTNRYCPPGVTIAGVTRPSLAHRVSDREDRPRRLAASPVLINRPSSTAGPYVDHVAWSARLARLACMSYLALLAYSGRVADDLLVLLIYSEPGMAERLLRKHTDDGTGRCAACSDGGQRGRHTWPCTIHRAATAALR